MTRFIMIGGFLGAGKTTAIARLASRYMASGAKVAIITNDQANDLVDTLSLRSKGFQVGEVPGACFCCKFNDLVETAKHLCESLKPDVVITEPVGSCTDLVATVVEPLQHLHGGEYSIAPYAVLLKPEHGLKILRGLPDSGFSPKAEYIFLKQLEEADFVVVNKVDKLSSSERDELVARLKDRFPEKPLLTMSAKSGEGFDALEKQLSTNPPKRDSMIEVDYDVYAEGEAELGWLNCQVICKSKSNDRFDLDTLLLRYVEEVHQGCRECGAEPAHLKVLGETLSGGGIANWVASSAPVELSVPSEISVSEVDLTVNARLAIAPEDVERIVGAAAAAVAAEFSLDYEIRSIQSFRPGRPTPVHRYSSTAP